MVKGHNLSIHILHTRYKFPDRSNFPSWWRAVMTAHLRWRRAQKFAHPFSPDKFAHSFSFAPNVHSLKIDFFTSLKRHYVTNKMYDVSMCPTLYSHVLPREVHSREYHAQVNAQNRNVPFPVVGTYRRRNNRKRVIRKASGCGVLILSMISR